MTVAIVERATISVSEMMKALHCSKSTIYTGLHSGIIPANKIGNRFFVGKEQFYKWLNSGEQIPKGLRR